MSYEVHGLEYETFEEVVEYAWNEHKIDVEAEFTEFSEEEKCRREPRHYDFEGVCECPKCSSTKFEKQITAHGKMACNWERWNVKK